MFDVVGVGANSVDHVVVLPGFPQPEGPQSKMRMRSYERGCGGQVATAMAACARFGLATKYVGAVGTDDNGRFLASQLSKLDIDISSVVIHRASNNFAVILLDARTGERVVLWDADERLRLSDAELPREALTSCRVLHVDDVDVRAGIAAARIARASGVPVTSDIDQATVYTIELLEVVTVAIMAEHVPSQITGRKKIEDALAALPRAAGQTLCATLGRHGAIALDDSGMHRAPAFHVRVVDTTGAGDVFRAGFIYAMLQGWGIGEQLRFANAAAALSCSRLGAIASVPSLDEVEGMLK